MPPKVSFRVFPADATVDLWSDEELSKGATLKPDDMVLRGDRADRMLLGPLSSGEYRVAARPTGQRYWSWASNELAPARAHVFPITEAGAVDMGAVEIECGPLDVAILRR
jgi:hypothetical protein